MKHLISLCVLLFACTAEQKEPAPPNSELFNQFVEQFAGIGFENEVAGQILKGTFPHSIVLTGSSSFTLWGDLAEERLAGYGVINRGIGGSDIRHQIRHAEALVFKHTPKAIVFYIGDNDMYAFSLLTFKEYLACYIDNLFWRFPYTKLVLISIKPSPSRTEKHPLYQHINALYATLASQSQSIYFINLWDTIAANPSVFFLPDNLHLSPAGYDLLTEQLIPILDQIIATEEPS